MGTEIGASQTHHTYINRLLTAPSMSFFMVPERAAAMPNRPLLRMFMATLKPSPSSVGQEQDETKYSEIVNNSKYNNITVRTMQ